MHKAFHHLNTPPPPHTKSHPATGNTKLKGTSLQIRYATHHSADPQSTQLAWRNRNLCPDSIDSNIRKYWAHI